MWLGDADGGRKSPLGLQPGQGQERCQRGGRDVHRRGGRLYWHRSVALTGELEQLAPDGKTLVGGQIKQLADLLARLNVPSVTIGRTARAGLCQPSPAST